VPLAGQPGYRRAPHHAGQHRRRQGAQPRQQVPRLAAGGRRPLRAPARLIPARPRRVPSGLPAAWSRLRPGSVRASALTTHVRRV
jgi:hypothetical protein